MNTKDISGNWFFGCIAVLHDARFLCYPVTDSAVPVFFHPADSSREVSHV